MLEQKRNELLKYSKSQSDSYEQLEFLKWSNNSPNIIWNGMAFDIHTENHTIS